MPFGAGTTVQGVIPAKAGISGYQQRYPVTDTITIFQFR